MPRLKGQGGAGPAGAPNGDLYLRIKLVPHPLFDVEYHDLILTLPVAPWEAALGTKIQIPTLKHKINLTAPPNSRSGQRLRIRGQGLTSKTGRGDLYAALKVVMPKATNLGTVTLIEIVEEGIWEPTGSSPETWELNSHTVSIAQKAVRLHNDLDIDWPGIALAISLIEELEQLRGENQHLRQRLQRFTSH